MERKEAIESLRQLYSDTSAGNKAALECLIPELKESEDEDERMRKQCIELIREAYSTKHEALECIAYLEKQKEQKPAEWSEEDRDMLNSIIATCKLAAQVRDSGPARHLLEMQERFLKSLLSRPKTSNNWKPSEEQMKAMEEVRKIFHNHHLWDEINPILYDYEELMRDLQKLI